MPAQRKIFRIEQMISGGEAPAELEQHRASPDRHEEIMAELRALRAAMAGLPAAGVSPAPAKDEGQAVVQELQEKISEARKFKIELDVIDQAIKKTKGEIVSMQDHGLDGGQLARATLELNAVVSGTTDATDRILMSAETIEQTSGMLAATLKTDHERALVQEIQDQVTQIFEACNFHDLTSQRITKVLTALTQVEDHIAQMVEIWGAIERFTNYVARLAPPTGDQSMLNGPKLDGEQGHVSQNDIDSLFH